MLFYEIWDYFNSFQLKFILMLSSEKLFLKVFFSIKKNNNRNNYNKNCKSRNFIS